MPDLHNAILQHRAIVASIRDQFPDESDETLADTIEGASGLQEAIALTLREAIEADAMADGLGAYIDKLKARALRWSARADKLREMALQAATEGGISKITEPDFTASVTPGKAKVIITGDVPRTFCRVKAEPNKTAIGEALATGLKPTWASLSNPQPFWTIRTK